MDDKPIYLRNQIYHPDHLVILDASLLQTTGVTLGLKPDGMIVINGKSDPAYYETLIGDGFQLFVVNAGAIAVAHGLGSPANPIVNTAILGAFSRATGLVTIDAVEKAIEAYVPLNQKNNRKAAREAYDQVVQK